MPADALMIVASYVARFINPAIIVGMAENAAKTARTQMAALKFLCTNTFFNILLKI